MAAVPSPVSSFSVRPAVAGDFDACLDAFEAVAAEGRWMGTEAPIDRAGRRAGFDRAVAGDGSALFLAEAGGAIVGAISAALSGGILDLGMFVVDGPPGGGMGPARLEAVLDRGPAAGRPGARRRRPPPPVHAPPGGPARAGGARPPPVPPPPWPSSPTGGSSAPWACASTRSTGAPPRSATGSVPSPGAGA